MIEHVAKPCWLIMGVVVVLLLTAGNGRAEEPIASEPGGLHAGRNLDPNSDKGGEDDSSVVRRRTLKPLLKPPDAKQVRELLDLARPDGSWPDMDYSNRRRAGWPLHGHLTRLLLLTRAYRSPESEFYGDTRLRKVVFAVLDYWLRHDFQNPNWWSNRIGVPRALAPVLLLLDGELSEQQRGKGLEILRRAKLGMTGQNLVWVAGITVMRGVFQDDPEVVEEAFKRIADETRVIPNHEGIQADYSFHQHGPCLYSHGYGEGFAADVSRLATVAAGTRFALPDDRIKTLSSLILDGHQWFVRGPALDYGTLGREITRQDNSVAYLSQVAENMLRLPTGRQAEFRDLARRIAGESGVFLLGNRHFWRSDIMVHRRAEFATSARMFSTRTCNTDAPCNSEGLKSHHLADGCNYLFRTGNEYVDIFPVWDWQKIPGTTVEQTPELQGSVRRKGERDFVGGVSDGTYGLAAFDLARDGLVARKLWAFFDREYVCLGAGISCGSDHAVATTVNQCLLAGEVTIGGGDATQVIDPGEHALAGPAWVHHDSVGYLFPRPTRLRLENRSRSGSWWSINHRYPDEQTARNVFTLWIDHGKGPRNAEYCYVVVPGVSADDLAAGRVSPDVEILRNERQLQAVHHPELGLTGAEFYEPGSLAVARQMTIEVDQPCLVLVQERDDRLEITVSNPKNEQLDVAMRVHRHAKASPDRNDASTASLVLPVDFSLPGGQEAGRSVTKTVRVPHY